MKGTNKPVNLATLKNDWLLQEMFNSILTNLSFINTTRNKKIQVIAVTSPNKGEGKSFFLNNYGITCAINNKKTLLIDSDFYNPSLTRNYKLKNFPGFSNLLIDIEKKVMTIKESGEKNLDVLPIGIIPPNPLELLNSDEFDRVMELLKKTYDVILIDCPPVQLFTESRIVGAKSDGVILITTPTTTENELANSKELLDTVGANLLGAVLNKKEYSGKSLDSYKNY